NPALPVIANPKIAQLLNISSPCGGRRIEEGVIGRTRDPALFVIANRHPCEAIPLSIEAMFSLALRQAQGWQARRRVRRESL
ncbi:hypothetical protein MUP29_09235, partial [bacterium]|nr:hypothetical protein [bacterium]